MKGNLYARIEWKLLWELVVEGCQMSKQLALRQKCLQGLASRAASPLGEESV